jgi:hypothetical protein
MAKQGKRIQKKYKSNRRLKIFKVELGRLRKEENLLRFQPCRGDVGLRRKEEALEELKKRIKSLDEKIWELERKLSENILY